MTEIEKALATRGQAALVEDARAVKRDFNRDGTVFLLAGGGVDEQAALKAYQEDPALQAEFHDDPELWLSYLKAASRGHVTTKL